MSSQISVVCDHATPLHICSNAIRQCWDSHDKSDSYELVPSGGIECGPNDLALIDRIGNKFKHASTLEHITFNFTISGVSRALLQEQARHRMASLSVKSSRYTLKELKNEEDIYIQYYNEYDDLVESGIVAICSKYLVFTGMESVDLASMRALGELQQILRSGVTNDIAKYCMPESYRTQYALTINARSLQNMLSLRSSKAALWEIRDLANAIFEALPSEYKYLFEDSIATT